VCPERRSWLARWRRGGGEPPRAGGQASSRSPAVAVRRGSAAAAVKRAAARSPGRTPTATRRTQQDRRRTRLRGLWLIAALAVMGAAGFGLYRGQAWLRAQPIFHLRHFDVVVDGVGGPGIDAAYFEDHYLADHRGESIFAVDLTALRGAVQADPWVKRAVVVRWLPDRLRLQVVVRDAVAVVTAGPRGWLVDRDGVVIEQTTELTALSLARIRLRPSERHWVETPAAIQRALTVLQASRRRGFPAPEEIRHLGFDELGDPMLVAEHGGIEIFLGRGDYPLKLDRLARILPDLAESKRRVARIDLRFKDRAVVAGPDA
jgi:cell division protein FtsQ